MDGWMLTLLQDFWFDLKKEVSGVVRCVNNDQLTIPNDVCCLPFTFLRLGRALLHFYTFVTLYMPFAFVCCLTFLNGIYVVPLVVVGGTTVGTRA